MSKDVQAPRQPETPFREPPSPLTAGDAASPPSQPLPRDGMSHMREDLWGIYVITKREFIANIKSFRSIVMVIILALIMVGAAMGFARLSSSDEEKTGIMYQLVPMDPDGQANDLVVFLYEIGSMDPVEGVNISLRIEDMEIPEYAGATDASGQWIAKDLTPAFHWLSVEGEEDQSSSSGPFGQTQEKFTYIYVPHNSTIGYPVLGTEARNLDIRDSGNMEDVAVWVVGPDGVPVDGATVTVGEMTSTTDSNGLTTFFKVPKGLGEVIAIDGALSGFSMVNVTHDRTETDLFALALAGPDAVLRLVAAIAIGLVGPIYAIVLCFDSVFRERISGSIDYLLCRPMGRRAVLMGKFTGILAALMVPISAVALMGVGVVTWVSEQSPTSELVVGFLIYTVFLIAIFVLLQMIFSTVAKTTGTAILSGIGIWIFFFMLFDLLILIVLTVMDLQDEAAVIFVNRASFLNPIGIYGMAIGQLGNDDPILGVPGWAPSGALISLTIILLIAAMEIFRRRVTE